MFKLSKNRFDKTSGGTKIPHFKSTGDFESKQMPISDTVSIPMLQHIGESCTPCVKIGDIVKVGTKIGDSDNFLSAPIHSSVSGVVKSIADIITAGGVKTKGVVIESDKAQTLDENIKPPIVNNHEEFVLAIKESGLVGLGGAGFPTHIKLNPKNLESIDTLLINGAECESFTTSDYREMLENSDDIINGILIVKKYLNVKKAIIGIENNKPDAIKILNDKCQDKENITVSSLKCVYPQGSEKILIKEITGKVIKKNQIPSDQGLLVLNVSTVSEISKYIKTGIPIVTTRTTVSGDGVNQPSNVIVAIGTPIKDLVNFCGGHKENIRKILMGGAMMGVSIPSLDYSIIKQNNVIELLTDDFIKEEKALECINCSRCVDVCPMNLTPPAIEQALANKNYDELIKLGIDVCIECGCCSFVCPSKRPVTQYMRLSKSSLLENKK
ncbi:MAG: electron transport complex subunit RsxC [Oscillospiraceae bacterium]